MTPRLTFLCLLLWAPLPSAAAETPANKVEEEIREAGRAWLAANDGVGLTIGRVCGVTRCGATGRGAT